MNRREYSVKRYFYGAAMYPELWDKEIVKTDIQEMKKIGSHSLFSDVLPAQLQSKLFEVNQAILSNTTDPEAAGEQMEAVKETIGE